ncbi:DUF2933 domain-containing protein [Streptomyces sp. NBC_00239]|uniref:DUF2933 domain-containing protein n=1 Tax=Streptomyces sp. NBC_00239 TaxID=2903640 RepID=UPI002E2B0993|nr:DUF2933 domain-containing protein [Streptomyces sp. NBC_00239]
MNTNRNYGLYALAAAIAFVGALAFGVPLGTLAWLALVAACPLMMFFMMRGMRDSDGHAGHDSAEKDQLGKHDHPTGPGRT